MLRLIFTFYRRYIMTASLLTIAVMVAPMPFGFLVIGRMVLSALLIATVQLSHPNENYYYRNLGLRPAMLWVGSGVLDTVIFLAIAIPFRLLIPFRLFIQ